MPAFASRSIRIVRGRNILRGRHHGGQQHVRERVDRLGGHPAARDRSLEAFANHAQRVGGGNLATHVLVEDRRRVDDADAPHSGVAGRVEVCVAPESELFDRIVDRHRRSSDGHHHLLLDGLEYGAEEIRLVVEVVVHRTAGHPGRGNDLLATCARVALLGEEASRGGDQRGARGRRPLGLRAPVTTFTVDHGPLPCQHACSLHVTEQPP